MLSVKVAVVSTCVLSVGVILLIMLNHHYSVVVPLAYDFPSCWNIIMLKWLKHPYLYLLINAIIIAIVASSKLQHKYNHHHHQYYPSSHDQISEIASEVSVYDEYDHHRLQNFSDNTNKVVGDEMVDGGDMEKPVTPPPPPPLQRSDSIELSVSARFGHRKAVKTSAEGGKALRRVSKSKRSETLESTWKTITEGRAMPLTRHLKKSDTWDSHVRQNTPLPAAAPPKMKKGETFHERTTTTSSGSASTANSGRLRREPSLSQDELNRRVEAFIKKFNEDMRLQRQRSLEHYNQMIIRGAN